jgi:RNA polymerase sigma-70 factor (ECF subfamily)
MNEPKQSRNQDFSATTSINLLNRVVSGDDKAWVRLVDIYSALIYSKCRGSGLNEQDAADVLQHVFISIHRAIPKFRQDGQGQGFRRWLRTITRNTITDHFRRRAKRPGDAGGGTDVLLGLQNLPDPFGEETSLSLADNAIGLMLRRSVESIRDDYENRTWQAFWRTAVDGERAVDVAGDLGMKPSTVRQAKSKILIRLRMELEDLL